MTGRPEIAQAGVTQQGAQRPLTRRIVVPGIFLVGLASLLVVWLVVTRHSDSAGHLDPLPAGAPASTFTPDVTWAPAVGVRLPWSRVNGPRVSGPGTASGFSQSEPGAALAAVHILIRSGANAGPNIYGPTITGQVTGANAPAMKLLNDDVYRQLLATSDVAEGAPVPGSDAIVLGYRIAAYNPASGPTRVEVYLTSARLEQKHHAVRFDVQLIWSHEDWRVVAPARGDWGTAATAVPDRVAGLVTYGGSH